MDKDKIKKEIKEELTEMNNTDYFLCDKIEIFKDKIDHLEKIILKLVELI